MDTDSFIVDEFINRSNISLDSLRMAMIGVTFLIFTFLDQWHDFARSWSLCGRFCKLDVWALVVLDLVLVFVLLLLFQLVGFPFLHGFSNHLCCSDLARFYDNTFRSTLLVNLSWIEPDAKIFVHFFISLVSQFDHLLVKIDALFLADDLKLGEDDGKVAIPDIILVFEPDFLWVTLFLFWILSILFLFFLEFIAV